MSEITELKLPESLPFPVKILSVDVQKGADIKKHQHIIRYSYWEFQDAPFEQDGQNDGYQQRKKVRVDLVGSYESPIDGVIDQVTVRVGDEILSQDQTIVKVIEPCSHAVQFGGLCAVCGKSLEEEADYSGYKYEDRAPISMSHGRSDLKISKNEAERVEKKMTKNLITERKLILVVDLDQTVIHVTVDPTIAEWMNNPKNPNHPSVKDVKTFTLDEEIILPPNFIGTRPPPHTRRYFLKERPGLEHFLKKVSEKYELHIYTMGTRAYAKAVAKCIDPDGNYFSDRILSRDESGSLTQKSLERLFPTDTSMVVIIDDRGDVWNWSDHLVKVVPFEYFVGIGDINSNFLPRQRSLLGPSKRRGSIAKLEEKIEKEETTKLEEDGTINVDENLAPDHATSSSEREASLEAQKKERPLAKLQHDLDELSPGSVEDQRLLFDDDDELEGLELSLQKIHETFYAKYDVNGYADIKDLLPSLKHKVFEGLEFVFSGLFPIGSNINQENIVIWSKSFGATVGTEVTLNTTHVIVKNPNTYKARLAKSLLPNVKLVHPNWIFNSLTFWRHSDEKDYEQYLPSNGLLSKEDVEKYLSKLQDPSSKVEITAPVVNVEEKNTLLGGDMNWLGNDDDEDFLSSEDSDQESDFSASPSIKRSIEEDDYEKESVTSKRQKRVEINETKDRGKFVDKDDDGDGEEDNNDNNNNNNYNNDDDDDDELAAELMLGLDSDEE
ncbi:hypothetical protein WICMUC_003213 [Wickerhamomyces mucosus]|uniref:RNA polymerase II subunit A C-terminal domain phosphatase n=1 Tax=Wickerhamomyces mucosus TaxID=1378264 RepID=A0A9P8TCX8_9ASCO|nr:hypothetical protein WICMUC_003213 [Wickerhamomyces mucosus]